MSDQLFAQYLLERKGATTIIVKDGFIAYKFVGLECFIVEMCIAKGSRNFGYGRHLIDKLNDIAHAQHCLVMTANIYLGDPGSGNTLRAALKTGFEIIKADRDMLVISKPITGDPHG